MFYSVFTVIAPTLLCALAGFTWKKLNKPYNSDMVTLLIMEIAAPCLIISTLGKLNLTQNTILDFGFYVLLALCCTAIVSMLFLKLNKQPLKIFSVPMIFGNHGNMGLPLCLFAFGEQGLALAVIYFVVISFFHYSIGLSIFSGRFSILQSLRSPIILSTLFALYLIFSDNHLPTWLDNTLTLMGNMTIPLMLIALGVSLASIKAHHFKHYFILAAGRLLIGFGAGVFIAEVFDLSGVMRGVIILQSTMPSAIFNYLLAERYKRRASDVAGVVVLSTLLSFISLPLLIPFVLK